MRNGNSSSALELVIESQEQELRLRSLTIKRWLRTKEVALYLGTSEGAIRNMVLRGKLKPRKYASRNYFSRDEIDGLIENSNSKRRNQWA